MCVPTIFWNQNHIAATIPGVHPLPHIVILEERSIRRTEVNATTYNVLVVVRARVMVRVMVGVKIRVEVRVPHPAVKMEVVSVSKETMPHFGSPLFLSALQLWSTGSCSDGARGHARARACVCWGGH